MAADIVASRYSLALFDTAKREGKLEQTLKELCILGSLLKDEPELKIFLLNPGLSPADKAALLDSALKGSWSEMVRSFVEMVLSLGRAECLSDVVEEFQHLFDKERGLVRVTVRSSRRLSNAALNRLRLILEKREKRYIEITSELVPRLIGGVQIILDHRVVDGSIQRRLGELREQLRAVRVH